MRLRFVPVLIFIASDLAWSGWGPVAPQKPLPAIPRAPSAPRTQMRPTTPLPRVPSKIKMARKADVKKLNELSTKSKTLSTVPKQPVKSRDLLRAKPAQAETSVMNAGVNGFVGNSTSLRIPSKVVDTARATQRVASEKGPLGLVKAPKAAATQIRQQTKQAGQNRDLHTNARSLYHARTEFKQNAQAAIRNNDREKAFQNYYDARQSHKALAAPTRKMAENLDTRLKTKSPEKHALVAGEVRTLSDTARDKSDLRQIKQELKAKYGEDTYKQWKDAGNGTENDISKMRANQIGRTTSDVGRGVVDVGVDAAVAAGTMGAGSVVSAPGAALTGASVIGKAANGQVRVNQTATVMRDKTLDEDQKQEKIAQITASAEKRDRAISTATSMGKIATNVTEVPGGVVNTIQTVKELAGDARNAISNARKMLQRKPANNAISGPVPGATPQISGSAPNSSPNSTNP